MTKNQNGDSRSVVKHNPHHSEVKGLNPATDAGTESDKEWQN